jgi:hypothetical protein
MSLVSERERHLKWRVLDPLEAVLYVACGACIIGFCTSVLLDVVTRQIGLGERRCRLDGGFASRLCSAHIDQPARASTASVALAR